jgi:hypothetical protein
MEIKTKLNSMAWVRMRTIPTEDGNMYVQKIISNATVKSQGYTTCVTTHVWNVHHSANRFASECCHSSIPVCFWYQQWLCLWPLLADALLLVHHCDTLLTSWNPTERNLMGLSHKTKWAKPLVHLFLSIFIQKSHYWSAEMQRCSIMLWPHTSSCCKRDIL